MVAFLDQYEQQAEGIVVDVRENGGGTHMGEPFAQRFLEKGEHVFGRMIRKKNGELVETKETIEGTEDIPIKKPVVILTSNRCASATEQFLARMEVADNVILVGEPTQGMTAGGQRVEFTIDNSDYYAIVPTWRFYMPNETQPVETTKIQPNIEHDPNDPDILEFAKTVLRNAKLTR